MNNSAMTLRTLLATILGASMSVYAVAQTTSVAKEEDNTVKLDKFVVTGSFIPMAADAVASPVTVLNSDEILKTGVTTNALEVLKKAIPQFQGNQNIGSNNANVGSGSTGGGSQASLRNLTTLTLINGRRAAVSPISGTGGNQFVDLNIIPLAAIESIEVLLDGASATYGSDATSGVINIKTKRDYNGAAVNGFYEWTDNTGGWANRGANFVVGAGNGKTNVTVAGGWSKQDPLWQYEREFSGVTYGTPTFGGVINFGSNYFVLNPAYSAPPVSATKPTVTFSGGAVAGTSSAAGVITTIPVAPDGRPYFGAVGSNAYYWGKSSGGGVAGFGAGELAGATSADAEKVAFNLANYVTILQRRESRGAMITFDHDITDKVEFFGDVLNSTIETFSQINAQPVGTTPNFNVTATHANNPFNNSVRVRNRFVTNPRQYSYNTEFIRAVGGFRGEINEQLSFETAINLNRSTLAYRNPGVIDSAGLLAAAGISPAGAAPTAINMFQRNVSPTAVASANFVGTGYNDFRSALRSWDGRVLYKGPEMGGGNVSIAVGGEVRKDTLKGTADLNSIPDAYGNIGWTGATSVNPFNSSREIQAAFVEALLPLAGPKQNKQFAHLLELNLAVRYEKYSDTDDPTSPKVSFRWMPFNDEFAVRGTWGQSFNAPTLYNLFGPSDVGFTPEVLLLPAGAANLPANYVSGQAQIRGGSNPTLKPATSDAYTFGVVWSPKAIKGFSTELTYWNIKEADIVGAVSSQSILQDVENNGRNSRYVAGSPNYLGLGYDVRVEGFFAGDGLPITAPGQVAGNIDSIYMSRPLVNISEQNASGIDLNFKYKTATDLGLFNFSANVAYWLKYQYDGADLDGLATVTGGTIPRWSTYVQGSWNLGAWDAFAGVRYLPKTNAPDEFSSGKTAAEAYATIDIGGGYTFGSGLLKGFRASVAIKNAANEMPPQLPDTFSNDTVDTGTYDPIGRTFLVSLEYKF